MNYRVDWELDGHDLDIPEVVEVPDSVDVDDVADWLTDTYGWLVEGLEEVV